MYISLLIISKQFIKDNNNNYNNCKIDPFTKENSNYEKKTLTMLQNRKHSLEEVHNKILQRRK